jgi:hypothetical protein
VRLAVGLLGAGVGGAAVRLAVGVLVLLVVALVVRL